MRREIRSWVRFSKSHVRRPNREFSGIFGNRVGQNGEFWGILGNGEEGGTARDAEAQKDHRRFASLLGDLGVPVGSFVVCVRGASSISSVALRFRLDESAAPAGKSRFLKQERSFYL
jgi:hypothetical protein